MQKLIKNAAIVTAGCETPNGYVAIENGNILHVGAGDIPERFLSWETFDAGGAWLCPGFIDNHCHGGGGHDFMDGTVEAILGAARAHMLHGTTTIAPTSLSSSDDELFQFIENYKQASQVTENMPHLMGMHLEGPHFSPAQAGAQPPEYLKNPSVDFAKEVLAAGEGNIVRWSIAPELPGALETGDFLTENGVLTSIAHTDAVYDDIVAAAEHGYTHMTHFYSGMSQMKRVNAFRVLGAVECGYLMDEMRIELIADGMHLPPELLQLILKLKPHDKITLVTDSMRGAGMPEGPSILGSLKDGLPVILEGGIAKLMDRSAFAGSMATSDRLVRTMVEKAGLSLTEAVEMMTGNVAKLYGIYDKVGDIAPGKRADIVILDSTLHAAHVFVSGTQVK
ncbi:MAG: N-acetylglucosamine-6-phosphate deacetylase [Clostridia bacterium]|nr:N-acetylglucosamine-6-phosphate deacetylase [Clostridia bacterium]